MGGGRPSHMQSTEKNITTYLKELHRSGKPLNLFAIIAYCTWRFRCFSSKSIKAKESWVARFVKKNSLSGWILQQNGPGLQPRRLRIKLERVVHEDVWMEQLRHAQHCDSKDFIAPWVYGELPDDDVNIRSFEELRDHFGKKYFLQPSLKATEDILKRSEHEAVIGDKTIQIGPSINDSVIPVIKVESLKICPFLNDPVIQDKAKTYDQLVTIHSDQHIGNIDVDAQSNSNELLKNGKSNTKTTKDETCNLKITANQESAKRCRPNPPEVVAEYIDESIRGCDVQIKRKIDYLDMDCLKKGKWINGSMLSFYLRKYIPKYDSIYNFCCQTYASILSYEIFLGTSYTDYLKFCGLTNQFDWAKFKYIFIPINQDGHWSFVVITNPMERLEFESTRLDRGRTSYYHVDSIAGYHNTDEVVSRIHRYMSYELTKKYKFRHSNRHRIVSVPTDPQQNNSVDCGIYVAHYSNVINRSLAEQPREALAKRIRGLCTNFSTGGCNKLRRSIANWIYADSHLK